jgi:radical SAM protein with 4Fe4S-binding SPASM domain
MMSRLVKPVNLIVAGYSYLKSSATKKVSVYGMPPAMGFELTNHCNLHCPECATGSGEMTRGKGFMDIALFKKIISEVSPYLYNINLYFQGEPMIHPGVFSFISNSGKIRTVMSTNGHFLTTGNAEKIAISGLSKLIVSLDGLDQETYSAYRTGGNVGTVMEGLENISVARRRYKSSLKLEIQVLVNRFNEHQIQMMRKLAVMYKASLRLKSMQLTGRNGFESWLPASSRYRRYILKDGDYQINSSLPGRCARLWFNPVVTWDGKVVPCCFDKDASYVMGDLNQESFREIWNGTRYRLFRRLLLMDRISTDICRNCTSGLRESSRPS